MQHIQASKSAFVALLGDGSAVCWGEPRQGGDAGQELKELHAIQAGEQAMAGVLKSGSLLAWGDRRFGGYLGAADPTWYSRP